METVAVVPEHSAIVEGANRRTQQRVGEPVTPAVALFVTVIGIVRDPADVHKSVRMIHYIHVGADYPSRRLLIDRLAPGRTRRAISLQGAHIGVVLPGPLIPPVRKIHFGPARFLFVTGYPLKGALALKLDSQRIGEIDDPGRHGRAIVSAMYREIALGRIACAAARLGPRRLPVSAQAIQSPTALLARSSQPVIEIGQTVFLEEPLRIGGRAAGEV